MKKKKRSDAPQNVNGRFDVWEPNKVSWRLLWHHAAKSKLSLSFHVCFERSRTETQTWRNCVDAFFCGSTSFEVSGHSQLRRRTVTGVFWEKWGWVGLVKTILNLSDYYSFTCLFLLIWPRIWCLQCAWSHNKARHKNQSWWKIKESSIFEKHLLLFCA